MRAAAAALLGAAASVAASACPVTAKDGDTIDVDGLTLGWRSTPRAIAVGHPFVIEAKLCPAQTRLVAVDATMPEHRHGMNYKPTVKALGGGRWRVEGLLWHMSGRWQLRFDVQPASGARQALTRELTLP